MKIEFVSYDGDYPNLCRGVLILKVDGEEIQFGTHLFTDEYKEWEATGKVNGHRVFDRFWSSGGLCGFDDDWNASVESGEWVIHEDSLPDFLKSHADELCRIFNDNVDQGCCGGCI